MLSWVVEGARVGVRIWGLRYWGGRVVVRIQDFVDVEGRSIFWAAISLFIVSVQSYKYKEEGEIVW